MCRKLWILAWLILRIGVSRNYAQGTVLFDTKILGPSARVTLGGVPVAGTEFFAQLWYGLRNDPPHIPIGSPVNFQTGENAGYVQTSGVTSLGTVVDPVVTIPTPEPGGSVSLAIKIWSTIGPAPITPTVSYTVTGIPGDSRFPPITLSGMQGVELAIPEPSTINLAGLGLLALIFSQWQKRKADLGC